MNIILCICFHAKFLSYICNINKVAIEVNKVAIEVLSDCGFFFWLISLCSWYVL